MARNSVAWLAAILPLSWCLFKLVCCTIELGSAVTVFCCLPKREHHLSFEKLAEVRSGVSMYIKGKFPGLRPDVLSLKMFLDQRDSRVEVQGGRPELAAADQV